MVKIVLSANSLTRVCEIYPKQWLEIMGDLLSDRLAYELVGGVVNTDE
jgi:hypothetical protein